MITYSEELPSLEQIEAAIIEKDYNLQKFLAGPICQLCAGKRADLESPEIPEGDYICQCKIVPDRDDDGAIRVRRQKITNYHLSWDCDALAPEIRIKYDYYWLFIRVWNRSALVYHIIPNPYRP